MKLVTANQMRAIEQSSVEAGVSLDELMENAGFAVAESIRSRFGSHSELFGIRVVILVGPGNNGADGFVAGRHLARWGAAVTCFLCTERQYQGSKRTLAEEAGAEVVDGTADSGVDQLVDKLNVAEVVIDAVLGTGASRAIDTESALARILFATLESAVPVVALDLPTGMNSDTGEFDVAGLPADETLMLGYPKLGPFLVGDRSALGEVSVLDIGIPDGLDTQVKATLMTDENAAMLLPERIPDGHKGTFGATLIVAGSKQYLGAATMATHAAVRSGNGLTFVATPDLAYKRIAGHIPEAMYSSLPTDNSGELKASEAASIALELAQKATSIVLGPGIGTAPSTAQFVSTFLAQVGMSTPLVLDADALNFLAGTHKWWERFENPSVLTPHPGELGRLLKISTAQIQKDRIEHALKAAERFNKVVVLKGASTVIASPDGRLNVSPWINSGLAQGGSGDVLAGLIGGLLAQSPEEPFEMATLGVYIHGYAASHVRAQLGETGMTASDVAENLGLFYRDFAQNDS